MKWKMMSAAVAVATIAAAAPAYAGSETGNFMVRVQGTVVDPDSSATVKAASSRGSVRTGVSGVRRRWPCRTQVS